MIEQLRELISDQESIFQEKLWLRLSCFEESLKALSSFETPSWNSDILSSIVSIWRLSDFVADDTSRFPLLLADLINSGDLFSNYNDDSLKLRLSERIEEVGSEDELMQALAVFVIIDLV